MKVLYLIQYAGKGGTERYVEVLSRYLSRAGLVQPCFAYNVDGPLVERMRELGVPTVRLDMRRRFDFQAAKQLARLCEQWQVDIVHCQFLREQYTALLAKRWNKHIRVVFTYHFVLPNDALTRLSNRLMDRRQDQMIAVCNLGRERLVENGWSRGRIRVIFNGVEPEAWTGTREESTLRDELGVDQAQFVLLYAARFVPNKGHRYLLEAAHRLRQAATRPFTLALAGDGPLLEQVQVQAKKLGLEKQVAFLGFRPDMKNLYLGSDLCVCPSEHEALTFFLIEGMAAGVPAVATGVGGNPDIINDQTGCGLLVPYADPEAMAQAILRFMEEPEFAARCRAGGLRAVRESFDVERMARSTYEVYRAARPEDAG